MCTFAKRCIWTALLLSCLSYGFGIGEALCAEPIAKEPRAKEPTAKKPTARELVAKLRAAQEPLKRSIVKSESYRKWFNDFNTSKSPDLKKFNGESDIHFLMEMRYDGRRYAIRRRLWGTAAGPGNTESNPACTTWLYDGKWWYRTTFRPLDSAKNDIADIVQNPESPGGDLILGEPDAHLRGWYANVLEPIEDVLADARSLRAKPTV